MNETTQVRRDASPLESCAPELIEKGYVAVPIEPGTKRPGEYDGKDWRPASNWQRRNISTAIAGLPTWETWPDAGVGVLLGEVSGIVAVDVDTDDPEIKKAIESITPGALVKKRGARGYTAFYRYNGEKTRKWTLRGECALELLSDGRQTVLPPSIHPGTRGPYTWTTPECLESIDRDELTDLPPDYDEQVDRKLASFDSASVAGSGVELGGEIAPEAVDARQLDELCSALAYIPADDRDVWIRVGMALKSVGEKGFFIWDNWSKRSDKYDAQAAASMRSRFDGFSVRENGVSYKTIFGLAIENGWTAPPREPELLEFFIKPGSIGNLAIAQAAFESGVLPRFYGHFKEAHNGQKECLCPSEESTAQSSSAVPLNRLANRASAAPRLPGNWELAAMF